MAVSAYKIVAWTPDHGPKADRIRLSRMHRTTTLALLMLPGTHALTLHTVVSDANCCTSVPSAAPRFLQPCRTAQGTAGPAHSAGRHIGAAVPTNLRGTLTGPSMAPGGAIQHSSMLKRVQHVVVATRQDRTQPAGIAIHIRIHLGEQTGQLGLHPVQ
jgi:hypothetical protein